MVEDLRQRRACAAPAQRKPAIPLNISRRSFLAAGVIGSLALATAGWLKGPHAPPSRVARRALDADGDAIVTAVVPALLAGVLPPAAEDRTDAIVQTVTAIDTAIAGLSPFAQGELQQLFTLLALPPVRVAFAGITAPWPEAAPADVRRFLDRLRDSAWLLPRSAYDALHQLTFAAWYGNPQAWPAIGYPGPPAIETGARR